MGCSASTGANTAEFYDLDSTHPNVFQNNFTRNTSSAKYRSRRGSMDSTASTQPSTPTSSSRSTSRRSSIGSTSSLDMGVSFREIPSRTHSFHSSLTDAGVETLCYVQNVAEDTMLITATKDKKITVWNAFTGKRTGQHYTSHALCLAAEGLPAGKFVSAAGSVKLWDVTRNKYITKFKQPKNTSSFIYGVRVLQVGLVATAHDDGVVRLWDPNSAKCVSSFTGHSGLVLDICSVNCDNTLISAGTDQTLCVWDLQMLSKRAVLRGHSGRVTSLASMADGTIASGSWDQTVQFWNPSTDARSTEYDTMYMGNKCMSLCSSAGLLAAGTNENTIEVWDQMQVKRHTVLDNGFGEGSLTSIIALPGGGFATGASNGRVKCWSDETVQNQLPMTSVGSVKHR